MTLPDFNWHAVRPLDAATADPAAGADPAAVTVPAGKRWLLLSAYVVLATDANVANRYVMLTVTDGTNVKGRYRMIPAHTASVTAGHSFVPGASANTTLTTYNQQGIAVEGIEMAAGWTFQITAASIQAGDDFGAVEYAYKEAPG